MKDHIRYLLSFVNLVIYSNMLMCLSLQGKQPQYQPFPRTSAEHKPQEEEQEDQANCTSVEQEQLPQFPLPCFGKQEINERPH